MADPARDLVDPHDEAGVSTALELVIAIAVAIVVARGVLWLMHMVCDDDEGER